MKNKKWFILWFTWLSWAGKTAIWEDLYKKLRNKWYDKIEHLDWDIIRKDLSKDLWFTKEDRDENLNRVAYISNLLCRNDVWVIVTFISPYSDTRKKIREKTINYIEVYVNTPLNICEERDEKWFYVKARRWEIKNFTGIDDIYDVPVNPEIEIDTKKFNINEWSEKILNYLIENNYI